MLTDTLNNGTYLHIYIADDNVCVCFYLLVSIDGVTVMVLRYV